MRTFYAFVLTALLGAGALSAQNCSDIYPMKDGASITMNNYDKKGKLSGSTLTDIVMVKDIPGGQVATISFKALDDKNEPVATSSYEVTCKENAIYFDIQNVVSPMLMQSYSSMEATVTGEQLVFPGKLSAGQSLPDASMQMALSSNGVQIMTMTMSFTERKVEAKETRNTPAGSFECYKITSTLNMKTLLMANYKTVDWFSPGVGMVRSETYNKKGELMSYSELAAFKR